MDDIAACICVNAFVELSVRWRLYGRYYRVLWSRNIADIGRNMRSGDMVCHVSAGWDSKADGVAVSAGNMCLNGRSEVRHGADC